MDPFTGKVALVTGGASGIGRALGEELGRQGATVVVVDKDREGAEQAAAKIRKAGARVEAVHLDVARTGEAEKVVQRTAAQHGRLDFMFNNAGIVIMGELRDTGLEHWQRVLEVNLQGVLTGTAAAYAAMVRQGSGHIVNTASLGGLMPSPMLSFYAATKYAVVGFSTSLREEAASLGVKVSVVCPGFVRTNIPDSADYVAMDKAAYLARLPAWLMVEPDKAARAILRGVTRNRAIIVFPFYARVAWWCYRVCPGLLRPAFQKSVREFRTLRVPAAP